ncbi:terminase large subunit [Paenibacillus larvae]|nr:terminase large subunit [Paenibacillus larvae]
MRDVIGLSKPDSIIEPQASDSEKLDGLNTHLAVFDEIHEYKNYDLINIIKNSADTREQPLFALYYDCRLSARRSLVDYYELGADVLEGVVSDERTFYYMAELDSEEEIDNPEM